MFQTSVSMLAVHIRMQRQQQDFYAFLLREGRDGGIFLVLAETIALPRTMTMPG
jgi:hypothetical protein